MRFPPCLLCPLLPRALLLLWRLLTAPTRPADVQQVCSPTRGSLLTGRFPLHLGYDAVIHDSEPTGVPLSMSLLPQALKAEGFETHQLGKCEGLARPPDLQSPFDPAGNDSSIPTSLFPVLP